MTSFLCFRLHGPLAAWGDVAVGERRPSASHPSRSAVLGLVAAGLGIRRTDADGLAALDRGLGFASRTDSPGELLIDFHTAQGPEEKDLREEVRAAKRAGRPWHRPSTRKAELGRSRHQLATLLSYRQFRVDALWTAALWLRADASPSSPWSLEDMRIALRRPRFTPYLGRKSCPLDLPLEPQLVEAEDPALAIAQAKFVSDELLAAVVRMGAGKQTIQWEDSWPGLEPEQSSRRRDGVLSRGRWQFTERVEHQRSWRGAERGSDVPQQG